MKVEKHASHEINAEKDGYFSFKRRACMRSTAHFHSAVELHLIISGSQTVTVNGEKRLLQRGEGCFIDSFCVHACENGDAEVFVLICHKSYAERALASLDGKAPVFFRFDDFGLFDALRSLCLQNGENGANGYETKASAFSLLFLAIARNNPLFARGKNARGTLVRDVLQYAEEHFADELSLAALSKAFGYSREYLSRTLSKYLHENWNVFVGRLRARKAHELLVNDDASSVLTIALACGFESASAFYAAYKREYGTPPRREKKVNI